MGSRAWSATYTQPLLCEYCMASQIDSERPRPDIFPFGHRLDDIEDNSELRRGYPAAHTVFGIPQTMNSANLAILNAVTTSNALPITHAIDIVLGWFQASECAATSVRANKAKDQLHELHVGQSCDLYWTRHNNCPSVDAYTEMISKSKLKAPRERI